MSRKIRIVSDLHIGHRASLIHSLDAMRPLAEGVDWLILNGDTMELKYGDLDSSHYDAQEQRKLFEKETSIWGIKVSVISGNHDPESSDDHSLSILDDQVFITHGDGLFREVAPWSSNVDNLRICSEKIDPEATGETAKDLHDYLQLHKDISLEAHELDKKYNPTLWGKMRIFLHQAWPPSTPFRILKCWRQVPDRAVSLTKRFSLSPKFIIVGHTHNPGIWTRGSQTVINTGSFFPWPGARCVDIEGETLSVRKIKKGQNKIEIGKVQKTFAIDPVRSLISS